MNTYLEKMIELDADGIDFIPFKESLKNAFQNVVTSYTKEELEKGANCFPRMPYRFWKIVNGKKEYLD